MLYFLFLFQRSNGILLYEKEFQIRKGEQMDMFGPFFSAIKTFISNIMLEGSKELKSIGLGGFNAYIIVVPEAEVDIVIIADKGDHKIIPKLGTEIKEIIGKYQVLFFNKNIDSEKFEDFDKKINEKILSYKKIIDPTILVEKQSKILKSIWEQKGKLSTQLREEREMELQKIRLAREELIRNFQKEKNLIKRLKICQNILESSEKLEEEMMFIEYQKNYKNLADEIYDRKLKLDYYLNKTKEDLKQVLDNLKFSTMKDGNYREVYLSLYSFASKLKNLGSLEICNKYRIIAEKLIEKRNIADYEFSQIISKILNMSNKVEDYFV